MGWGEKAIEIRSVETGHLDGVFMHKRAQRLKFLCERNDKVKKHKLDSHRLLYAGLDLQSVYQSGVFIIPSVHRHAVHRVFCFLTHILVWIIDPIIMRNKSMM